MDGLVPRRNCSSVTSARPEGNAKRLPLTYVMGSHTLSLPMMLIVTLVLPAGDAWWLATAGQASGMPLLCPATIAASRDVQSSRNA